MSRKKKSSLSPAKSEGVREPGPAAVEAAVSSNEVSLASRGLLSFRSLMIAVTVLALVVRLVNVLLTVSVPSVVSLVGDAAGYFQWAEKIADGNWYGDRTFYQAPLYPYTLAVLLKMGVGITGIRIFQAVLGAVGVACLIMATRIKFGDRAGLLAGVMLALFPPAIYYDGILQKASLASFLLCGLLWSLGTLQRDGYRWQAVIVGVLLGLLVLTRENALLWIPLIGIWLLASGRTHPWKRRVLLCATYGVGLAVPLLPVAARNASLGGEWSPTTFQAGPNFYIGNNLEADGIYRPLVPGHETPLYERADAVAIAEATTGRPMSAREVSRFWMSRALREIRQAPTRWLGLMFQKSMMVINHFEVPDVESMAIYLEYSPVLRLSAVWNFASLMGLAVFGILIHRGRDREFALDYLLIVSMLAAVVGFFILGRYRLPLVPLLIPFASAGVAALVRHLRARSLVHEGKLALVGSAIALGLGIVSVHDTAGLKASSMMNVGIAAGQSGDIDTAIRLMRESIRLEPSFAEAHYNLGKALAMSQQSELAIRSLYNAAKLDPSLPMVSLMLAELHLRLGDIETARAMLEAAAQNPADRERALGLLGQLQ